VKAAGCKDGTLWTGKADATLAYQGDGHPTPKANKVIAEALANRILKLTAQNP